MHVPRDCRVEGIRESRETPSRPALAPRAAAFLMAALAAAAVAPAGEPGAAAGLHPLAMKPLPVGSIRPEGWLKDQLRIQADGLSGNLDTFWPDVQQSGWIGGTAEGWERLPYWLDGFVPLAYELDDPKLEEKVQRHVGYILDHQQEDGWLGPQKSAKGDYKARDPWPVFVMMKALTQYQEATGDPRVVPALTRFLRCLDQEIDKRALFEWNRMRWQDGALSVYWLHERLREPWLLELAKKMDRQGFNWRKHFEDLSFKGKVAQWRHESHVVNNAMGVKAPAVSFRLSGDPNDGNAAETAIAMLDTYHGQAAGHFSGDECFAGLMPSQGTETCAIVEYMFSVETLLAILGRAQFADRLEKLAFNALPAPFKPDMWARQYVQQANQAVARLSEDHVYTTNGADANVFGLETNYGCCTANMHQGWPKFVAHLWMETPDGGLAAVSYAPARISVKVKDVPVTVEVKTDYPFSGTVQILVSAQRAVRFPIEIRVPAWAEGATLSVGDGAPFKVGQGRYHPIDREWNGTTGLTLRLPLKVRVTQRYNKAISVERGPLVYSLRIGESWKKIGGEEPHANWEVHPTTPWNYGLLLDRTNPERSFEVVEEKPSGNPFDSKTAPVRLVAKGRLVPDWTLVRNAAAPPPQSPVKSSQPLETITLIPYGAAKLRITEFPVLEE